ncbi:hypothetical protein B0O80DRAFT_242692 [Mortierella sp. GBAus27b]|nr:hypothetical protein B0O80DRAFT_242692 [Mortierella sp. GBAus27b]
MEDNDSGSEHPTHTRRRRSTSRHSDPGRSRSRGRARSRSRSKSRSRERDSYRHGTRHESPERWTRGNSQSPTRGHNPYRGSNKDRGLYRTNRNRDRDRDRDRESRQSNHGHDNGGRHRHQSSWRRDENDQQHEEPQLEIILQGLPLDCQESDIRAIVEQDSDIGLETVRLARDRHTGIMNTQTSTTDGTLKSLFVILISS